MTGPAGAGQAAGAAGPAATAGSTAQAGSPGPAGGPALDIAGLRVSYGPARAVRDASLRVAPGQVVALIGETGSGKSSLALAAARLLPGSAEISGRVSIAGHDITALGAAEFRRRRAALIGYIAQDAMAALNPVMPVGRQVGELFRAHRGLGRRAAADQAAEALARMRIPRPGAVARLFPHQLSGGMRQRVMIAMAVALSPPLLIADEPTTALDVSTQAEILGLVGELRAGSGSGILWITHDMGVVAELADWVAVMYAGRIVEQGPVTAIFDQPAHPYTEGLLRTRADLRGGRPGTPLFQVAGSPPAPGAVPPGCAFAPRCPRASAICTTAEPQLALVRGQQEAACHHPALSPPGESRPPARGPAGPAGPAALSDPASPAASAGSADHASRAESPS
jgi:oligopeptide/dipeptide ABC transporter ATP-binding protein